MARKLKIMENEKLVLYVLDEPSIGLHQRDNDKLIATLKHLRDLKNTVLVVEHDEDTMRESDYIIDIGPGAGKNGGRLVAAGTPEEVAKNDNSVTGKYLSGKLEIPVPKKRRKPKKDQELVVVGARENHPPEIRSSKRLREIPTPERGSGKHWPGRP